VATLVAALAVAAGSYTYSGVIVGFGWNAGLLLLAGILVLVLLRVFMAKGREGWSFILSTLGVLVFSAAIFAQLFPNVMVSSTDPQFNLTIYNAASGSYTLGVMSKVACSWCPWYCFIRVGHTGSFENAFPARWKGCIIEFILNAWIQERRSYSALVLFTFLPV